MFIEFEILPGNNSQKALLIRQGGVTTWIPFSQMKDFKPDNIRHTGTATIPNWLAAKKGLKSEPI